MNPKIRFIRTNGRRYAVVYHKGKRNVLGRWDSGPMPDEVRQRYRDVVDAIKAEREIGNSPEKPATVSRIANQYLGYVYHCANDRPTKYPKERYRLSLICELIGSVPLAELTPLAVEAALQKLVQRLAPSTVNDCRAVLLRAIRWAETHQYAPAGTWARLAPVCSVQRHRPINKNPRRYIDWATIEALRPYLHETMWAMLVIARHTGARPSEVCAMRPCDLEKTEWGWMYKPEHHKTERFGHIRLIPITGISAEVLQPILEKIPYDGYCFVSTEMLRSKKRRKRIEPVYSAHSFRVALQRAIRRANRKREVKIPKFSPYDLRHSALTDMQRTAGWQAAQALGGHSRATTTERYVHGWMESMLTQAVQALRTTDGAKVGLSSNKGN